MLGAEEVVGDDGGGLDRRGRREGELALRRGELFDRPRADRVEEGELVRLRRRPVVLGAEEVVGDDGGGRDRSSGGQVERAARRTER